MSSEADGYAVLTYVLTVVEDSSSSYDQGLSAALNEALSRRTTDGCECVVNSFAVNNANSTPVQASLSELEENSYARVMRGRTGGKMGIFGGNLER